MENVFLQFMNKVDIQTQETVLNECIKEDLKEINNNLKAQFTTNKDLVFYSKPNDGHPDSIAIINPKICRLAFEEKQTPAERYVFFHENHGYIVNKAISYINRITSNREAITNLIKDLKEKVSEKYSNMNLDKLIIESKTGDCLSEEYDLIEVTYNGELVVSQKFPLCIGNKKNLQANTITETFNEVMNAIDKVLYVEPEPEIVEEIDPEILDKLNDIFSEITKEKAVYVFEDDVENLYQMADDVTFIIDRVVLNDEAFLTKLVNKVKEDSRTIEITRFIESHFEGADFTVTKKSKYPYDLEKKTINPFFNPQNDTMRNNFLKDYKAFLSKQ